MSRLYWAHGGRVWDEDHRAYRCDWCGRVGRWDDNWKWYGSWLDREDGNEHHLCSSECASKWGEEKHGGADGVDHPRALVLTATGAVRP